MNDDNRTEADRRPQRRSYGPQRDGNPNDESDHNGRMCGACGEPIHGQAYFTAWGPVHKFCQSKAE
jgi:hypothetical protein